MTNNIRQAITHLVKTLREESPLETVSFNLFVNCQEHKIEATERTPKELDNDGISMRNLRGDFIK